MSKDVDKWLVNELVGFWLDARTAENETGPDPTSHGSGPDTTQSLTQEATNG
jgi:hypothetical protein